MSVSALPVPDFWHPYDNSVPSSAPELPEWQQVWVYDPDLGVNVGFWTGNGFRLYDKSYVITPTHWAHIARPPAPSMPAEAKAS